MLDIEWHIEMLYLVSVISMGVHLYINNGHLIILVCLQNVVKWMPVGGGGGRTTDAYIRVFKNICRKISVSIYRVSR